MGLLSKLWPRSDEPISQEDVYEVIGAFPGTVDYGTYQESYGAPVLEEPDEQDWRPTSCERDYRIRDEELSKVREIVQIQPHCKRALDLYVNYVVGSEFFISVKPREEKATDSQKKVVSKVDRVWKETLKSNRKSWSPSELVRRTYRDGEQFTREFPGSAEKPDQFRFIDPEDIRGEDEDETKGIVTDDNDITQPVEYELYDHAQQKIKERIEADAIFHTKIDCDSSEKRGRSRFLSVYTTGRKLNAFTDNEVTHRNMQSSIVLVRKVDGPASAGRMLLDNAKTGTTDYPEGTLNREKIRRGTIATVHRGVSLEFAQPQSDFSDASPLGKFLIQHIAAATGWTYSMLAATSDDGNLAAALVQESPVLQMVNSERNFFAGEFEAIYKKVIERAIKAKKIEGYTDAETFWDEFEIDFRWGSVVSRDILKEAQAANIGVMAQGISRAEMSRRMQASPEQMRREVEEESKQEFYNAGFNSQNPDGGDKQTSSSSNAAAGGKNQGADGAVTHDDKQS